MTPKKNRQADQGDRFIPSRGGMDIDVANFNLTSKENHPNNSYLESPAKAEYASSLSDCLFEKNRTKVLAFKNKAPAPKEGYSNRLHVLYSQNKTAAKPKVKTTRAISSEPERVLDAPGIVDDYYLNLLDWSCNNTLAVALGPSVYLWNATTAEITELMSTATEDEETDNSITSVSWSEDGSFLAVGTNDSEVQLWDVTRTKKVRSLQGHSARVGALAWNRHILSSGSRDSSIFNHDVRMPNHHIATLQGHSQEVCGLKWSPDGTQLASGGNDNILNIWDAERTQPKFTLEHHTAAVKALAWCPWQPHLLATGGGTTDRCIKFWNSETGACLNSVDTGSQVCALQWSKNYKELVSSHGFSQNQLTVWKYPTMEKVTELHGHTSRVLYLAQSPDGETVVSGAGDERLRFWKVWPKQQRTTTATSAKASSAVSRSATEAAGNRVNRPINIR